MSSYKNLGEDKNSASPCADCLSWLNTSRYFDNNTTIVSLEKNENTGRYTLNLNSIEQYLPYRNDVVNVIVNIKTMGMLNTKYATPETLVITCDRDKINVRTIKDYMPEQFKFKQKYKI